METEDEGTAARERADGEGNNVSDVGYKRPPLHSRFRKGAPSPNPSGRPKGARGFKTDFFEEISETISVTENGKRRGLSKQRILVKTLVTKALKGDPKAAAKVIELSLKLSAHQEPERAPDDLSQLDHEILSAFLERNREKA